MLRIKEQKTVHPNQPAPLPFMHCLHPAQPGLGGGGHSRPLAHGLGAA